MTEFIDSLQIYVNDSGGSGPSQVSLYKRWTGIGLGTPTLAVKAGVGPRGDEALFIPFGGAIYKTLSHQQTYTIGFHVNMSCLVGVGNADLIQIMNVTQILCSLMVNPDGSILVYANNDQSRVVCTCPAGTLQANTWQFLELQSTISGTTSVVVTGEVHVDNVVVGTGSASTGLSTNDLQTLTGLFGINVVPFFAAVYNRVGILAGCNVNGQAYIADLYINTSQGTVNTGFLGPVEIDAYPLPNGDGSTLQWTPLSGSTHYVEINELPSNNGATYNYAASAPLTDTFTWEPVLSFTGTVKTVQISYDCESTDEGFCAIESCIGSDGSQAQSNPFPLPNLFNYWHYAFDLDPTTGLPWTISNFNSRQKGITRSS